MDWLMNRLRGVWDFFTGPADPFEVTAYCGCQTNERTRVGLLNTGELVVIGPLGHLQVFGTDATDLIAKTLHRGAAK